MPEEILNIEYHLRQMILVALNTSCCVEGACKKLGITRRALMKRRVEYGIVREGNRYIVKNSSQSMRQRQTAA